MALDTIKDQAPPQKVGRPRQEPTRVISLRLPMGVIEIIQRRAAKAHMAPGVWLAERVIYHEVVRSHHKRKEADARDA